MEYYAMTTRERRLAILEQQIPLRCPQCGQAVECSMCNGWKDDARHFGIDPERLIACVRAEIDAALSGSPHDVFLSHGYDVNKLTVEELRQLRVLLSKAGGTAHDTT
jgi:hypothetical protein